MGSRSRPDFEDQLLTPHSYPHHQPFPGGQELGMLQELVNVGIGLKLWTLGSASSGENDLALNIKSGKNELFPAK